MSFSTALLALMPSTMVVYGLSSWSTDGYGEPVFSTSGTSYRCHVMNKQTMVRTLQGDEQVSDMQVWVRTTATFDPTSKLTVSGSTVGPILALEHHYDEDGLHHTKVFF